MCRGRGGASLLCLANALAVCVAYVCVASLSVLCVLYQIDGLEYGPGGEDAGERDADDGRGERDTHRQDVAAAHAHLAHLLHVHLE